MTSPAGVTVATLLGSRSDTLGLALDLLAGADGLSREVTSPHVQKTGLALAGFDAFLKPGRVLVFGESEVRCLEGLDVTGRVTALRRMFAREIPCLLVTGGLPVVAELPVEAERAAVPLLVTPLAAPKAIAKLSALLDDSLAERETRHGVLLDILGLGVLIVGESGIGKSECALDLIVRGHRLVADDAVEVRRRAETILIGTCPELTRHHMELRGLGLINVKDLFGIASIRAAKRIELVVRLERWDASEDYDRLGLDEAHVEILGLKVPLVRMPVAPGRNIAILIEVAARNQLLRGRGQHAARDLAARLESRLQAEADASTDDDLDATDAVDDA